MLVADAANRWLAWPRVTATIEQVSGVIVIGLGLFTLLRALLPAT